MNIKTLSRPSSRSIQSNNRVTLKPSGDRLACNDKALGVLGCAKGDIFVADTYHLRVTAYPTNEIAIRLNPHSKGRGDSEDDRLNKFDSLELVNGTKILSEDVKEVGKIEKKRCDMPGWGALPKAKFFSIRSQKKVERSVAALQAKYGKENTRFMTMTLPGSTEKAMRVVARYSGYIVNRVNRFCSNIIGKDAANRVNVWELQKRGALHSHTLVASSNKEGLERIEREFKGFCYRLFQELSIMTGVDMFEREGGGSWKDRPDVLRCNCEAIRVSASSYMSKYMSKNDTKGVVQGDSSKTVFYPSVWASYGRGATEARYDRTYRLKDKRIDSGDSRKLVLKCIELSKKYSPEKYNTPIVYLDRIGYGVNVKTYVKPEYLDAYIDDLEDYLKLVENRKNPSIEVRQVGLEAVHEMWSKELRAAIANEDIKAKYGVSDERLWRKEFRKNPSELPRFTSAEQWGEYYSREIRSNAVL